MDPQSIGMIVALILLVTFSAYFSATETAFTSLNRIRMRSKAEGGDRRAALAQSEGFFDDQIIPITVPGPDGQDVVVAKDEGIRPGCNIESLSQLKPCFLEDGLVTAATSSQRTDGAHVRGEGSGAGPEALGPLCGLCHRRRACRGHGRWPHRGGAQGAEEDRYDH